MSHMCPQECRALGRQLPGPRVDWSRMRPGEHLVQFYERDEFLLESLRGYVGAGLERGEAVIVSATPEHRLGLEQRLAMDGVDVATARREGRYLDFDAADTLARVMTDGTLDGDKVRALGGETLDL